MDIVVGVILFFCCAAAATAIWTNMAVYIGVGFLTLFGICYFSSIISLKRDGSAGILYLLAFILPLLLFGGIAFTVAAGIKYLIVGNL